MYIILLLYKRKWKLAGYFLITPFIKRGKNGKILSWSSLRTEISNLRNIFLTTKIIQVSTKIQRLSNLITWVLHNKERFLKAKYKTYQQNSHTWWWKEKNWKLTLYFSICSQSLLARTSRVSSRVRGRSKGRFRVWVSFG